MNWLGITLVLFAVIGLAGTGVFTDAQADNGKHKAKGCEKANENGKEKVKEKNPNCDANGDGGFSSICDTNGDGIIDRTEVEETGITTDGGILIELIEITVGSSGGDLNGVIDTADELAELNRLLEIDGLSLC